MVGKLEVIGCNAILFRKWREANYLKPANARISWTVTEKSHQECNSV